MLVLEASCSFLEPFVGLTPPPGKVALGKVPHKALRVGGSLITNSQTRPLLANEGYQTTPGLSGACSWSRFVGIYRHNFIECLAPPPGKAALGKVHPDDYSSQIPGLNENYYTPGSY